MEELLGHILKECVKHGVTLKLGPVLEDEKDPTMSGYWNDDTKVLAITTAGERWVETLTHEFAHFLQWRDGEFTYGFYRFVYSDIVDDWLAGKVELKPESLREYVRGLQACEQDAEKRAVELFKKYKIDVDIKEYIKQANAYVLLYNLMEKHRKWDNVEGPSQFPEILALMSDEFITDFEVMPEGYEELVIEKCFPKPKPWWRFWSKA